MAPAGEDVPTWIYQADGEFAENADIPPERIVGAWPVESSGAISGEFMPNPNYVARDVRPAPDPGWTKA